MEKNNETDVSRWVDARLATLHSGGPWQPNTIEALAKFRSRRDGGHSRMWIGAATVAATGICLISFPAPRVLAQRCVDRCVVLWQSMSNPAGRKMAPDFTLTDASARRVTLSDFRGKVVLLDFWATYCGACKVELPWFIEFERTYRDRGLVVLGVSLDEDGWNVVKPFIEQRKINYRVMLGNDDVAARYGGVESLPTTVLIDRSGRIASTHVGLVSKNTFEAEIEALLKSQ